jgi:hypothetical protein
MPSGRGFNLALGQVTERNLAIVDVVKEIAAELDEVSAVDPGFPHAMLASDHIRVQTRGDLKIQARH